MREILFRGKSIDNGEWVFGDFIHEPYGIVIQYYEDEIKDKGNCAKTGCKKRIKATVDPKTVCQYTGLTGKNSNKIWENDITKLVLPDGEVRYFKVSFKKVIRKVLCHPDFDDDVEKVELNAICFEWNGYELFPCIDKNGVSDISKMEVIGNIFDNPELLEVEQ